MKTIRTIINHLEAMHFANAQSPQNEKAEGYKQALDDVLAWLKGYEKTQQY